MTVIDLTDYTLASDALAVHSLTRGFQSEFTGYRAYTATVNDYWAGALVLKGVCELKARALRAKMAEADGRAGGVLLKLDMPEIQLSQNRNRYSYSDETDFSDGTSYDDLNTGAMVSVISIPALKFSGSRSDQLTIKKIDGVSSETALGRMIATSQEVEDPDYQVVQITSVLQETSGALVVRVRPRLRHDIVVDQVVVFGNPPLKLRFLHDQPAGAVIIHDSQCDPVEMQLIEYF